MTRDDYEDLVLAAYQGEAYEQARPWWDRRPPPVA